MVQRFVHMPSSGNSKSGTMFRENFDKYLYRRQYFLGPRPVELPGNWKTVQIAKDYILSFQEDLSVTSVSSQNKSIHLLGYIIDSKNPFFDDEHILISIIDKSKTPDEVFENLVDKCGQFVVILIMGDTFRIFSDACGLRPVFYHRDNDNRIWCASQPHLIANNLGLKINEYTRRQFQQLPLFQGEEYWYPGTLTLFDNIYHLLPNHYLDIISGKAHRYWPRKVLTSISMSECLPIVSEILSNIIEGASYRFNLAFAISCGLDSRTLFSTSRKVADKIKYFSFSSDNTDKLSPDADIPAKMLRDLRLEHHIISPLTDIDRELLQVFKKTIFTARQKKVMQALSFYNYFKEENKEFLVISGDFSDITKRSRMRFPKTPKILINGSTLAAMARMPSADLAKKEFSKWLASTKKLTKFNIDILDLMHWEQRMANWGAKTLWEHEIIHESLCPFTCRSYIEFMLRVPLKFRTNPDYKLHRAIIAYNWPEALNYDINPSGNKIKTASENFLYKTNLYDPIQFLNILFIKRFKSKDLI